MALERAKYELKRKVPRWSKGSANYRKNTQERREYLMRNGYSKAGIDQLRERNINVVKTLKEKDKEMQKQNPIQQNKKGTI